MNKHAMTVHTSGEMHCVAILVGYASVSESEMHLPHETATLYYLGGKRYLVVVGTLGADGAMVEVSRIGTMTDMLRIAGSSASAVMRAAIEDAKPLLLTDERIADALSAIENDGVNHGLPTGVVQSLWWDEHIASERRGHDLVWVVKR